MPSLEHAFQRHGRIRRTSRWAHLFADSQDELHAFARGRLAPPLKRGGFYYQATRSQSGPGARSDQHLPPRPPARRGPPCPWPLPCRLVDLGGRRSSRFTPSISSSSGQGVILGEPHGKGHCGCY